MLRVLAKIQKILLTLCVFLAVLNLVFDYIPQAFRNLFVIWAFESPILVIGLPVCLVIASTIAYTFYEGTVGNYYVEMYNWSRSTSIDVAEFVSTTLFYLGVLMSVYVVKAIIPIVSN